MIFDIWENTADNRNQVSKLEAKNFDEAVFMVKDYYIKKEFHGDIEEDYIDDQLTYLTIINNSEIDENDDFQDYDVDCLTFEIHLSDDQKTRDFKMITGHNEFITLENGELKTPESIGKKFDRIEGLKK